MSSHADVRLQFAHDPKTDQLVVTVRLQSDDPSDPPRQLRIESAPRRALIDRSKSLREGASPTTALPALAEAVKDAIPSTQFAALESLSELGVALPSRRVIVEGAEANTILLEACGAVGHWPGLTDHWQWVRYAPLPDAPPTESVTLSNSMCLSVLCVLGSHEAAGNKTSARHHALEVLRALRDSTIDARFVIAASELKALHDVASSTRLDDLAHWLTSSPPNLVVATDVGVLSTEIERGREMLLWLGHSDAMEDDPKPATALVLCSAPESAPASQRLGFDRLAELLRGKNTRLCALLACRGEPLAAPLLLKAVDHAVVTDGFVPVQGAALFARTLAERLAALDPVGEAVRVARACFEPIQRWHVQHWTRTLDPRPFIDRKARAVANYLSKTPRRPADEESPLFAGGADWHATRAVELEVDEGSGQHKHHRWHFDTEGRAFVGEEVLAEPWWSRAEIKRAPTLRTLLSRHDTHDPTHAGRWLVLGEPGSGKSTMLQRERVLLARAPNRPFVPIFVKLAHWSRDERQLRASRERFDIDDYVEHRFQMEGSGLADGLRERAERGEVCYLLDGLDEVPDRDGCDERVGELLAKLAEDRPLCPIVVTSRPIEARNYTLAEFTLTQVQPLSEERQLELLTLRFDGDRTRAEDLLAGLGDNPTVQELARNPLFLTLFAMTAGDGSRKDLRPHDVLDACIKDLLEGRHRKKPIAWPATATLNRRMSALVDLAFAATRALTDEVDDDALREGFAVLGGDLGELLACLRQTGLLAPASSDGLVTTGWAFGHRLLKEALVSRELAARWAKGGGDRHSVGELARELCSGDDADRDRRLHFWAEPFALMAGRVGEHGPDAIVQTLIDDATTRPIGLRALVNAHRLSPDTIAVAFAKLEGWEDRRRVIEGLLERVPHDQVVSLLARLGRSTSDGNDLFFLWLQLERLEALGGARGAEARLARERLFDHLEPVAEDMQRAFSHVPGRPEWPAFCHIAPGVFDMGDDSAGWERRVKITQEFWIGATAVTVGQYRLFDSRHECRAAGESRPVVVEDPAAQAERDRFPVVDITWFASVSFTRWLSRWQALLPELARLSGELNLEAALPTEAQWEFAARAGGSPGQRFWFGDDDGALPVHARAGENWRDGPFHVATATKQASPPPSPWGLFDVHGGVWEWCSSEFDGDRRAERVGISSSASSRVLRGGSFYGDADLCRSACRYWNYPALSNWNFGFRVVLAVRSPASEPGPR